MRRTTALMFVFLFCFVCQACISNVKPVLKQSEPDIRDRITVQQKLIEQGALDGEFKPGTVSKLRQNLRKIKEKHSRAVADGGPTPEEEKALANLLKENNEQIKDSRRTGKK